MTTYKCYKCRETGKQCTECRDSELKAQKLAPAVQQFVELVQPLAGFVKTTGRGFHSGLELWQDGADRGTWVLLENAEAGIKIALNVSDLPASRYSEGKKVPCRNTLDDLQVRGHTCYKSERGWLTFDRRGVSDSFYLGDYSEPPAEVSRVLEEQLVRIEEAKETSKKMVQIPGFGFRVHQDQLEALKQKLQKGGSHTFVPGGFGTGHIVSTRRTRFAKPLPREIAAFFGVPALYDEQFDHD